MNIESLNAQFSLPDHLTFVAGKGGQVHAEIRNAHAAATVSLLGGQVLAYTVAAGEPLLWQSELADHSVGKAIRGGVPVIWPWFGGHPGNAELPSHGLVRSRLWQVQGTRALENGRTELLLFIESDDETLAIWPHRFRLEVAIQVGARLQVQLTARNTGEQPFHWSAALHSYFAVGAIGSTQVEGLDGVVYRDKVLGGDQTQSGPVVFSAETDRVYLSDQATVSIHDSTQQRRLLIEQSNHDSVIVWNPGETAKKHDLSEHAFDQFVCVETASGAGAASEEQMPQLQPNQSVCFGFSLDSEVLVDGGR